MRSTIGIRQAAKAFALAAAFITFAAASAHAAWTSASVSENDGIAATGLFAPAGHPVKIVAGGQIWPGWSGVWFKGPNGPNGPEGVSEPAPSGGGWPKPWARKFGLLAKVAGTTRYVGNGTTFTPSVSGMLHLQINDNVPGNGTGAFQAFVQVL